MNTNLLLMMGVALLLAGHWSKGWSGLYRWACLVCAIILAIQPVVATLRWLGSFVGV